MGRAYIYYDILILSYKQFYINLCAGSLVIPGEDSSSRLCCHGGSPTGDSRVDRAAAWNPDVIILERPGNTEMGL